VLTIGLIGGMSWQSTAHYYALLNRAVARRLGGLHSAQVIVHSVDFAPIAALQRAGDWERAGDILASAALALEAQGCGVLGLASNTMHICFPRIIKDLMVPMVHIAEPTAAALLADGMTRVGLLGTRFTMEKPFYINVLERHGLSVLVPDVGLTNLDGIIYEELCHGIVRDASRREYIDAIQRLKARVAEAVILGCTEIALLVGDARAAVPLYDTTAIHAEAAVALALASD